MDNVDLGVSRTLWRPAEGLFPRSALRQRKHLIVLHLFDLLYERTHVPQKDAELLAPAKALETSLLC